jgi:hypothetical protein
MLGDIKSRVRTTCCWALVLEGIKVKTEEWSHVVLFYLTHFVLSVSQVFARFYVNLKYFQFAFLLV